MVSLLCAACVGKFLMICFAAADAGAVVLEMLMVVVALVVARVVMMVVVVVAAAVHEVIAVEEEARVRLASPAHPVVADFPTWQAGTGSCSFLCNAVSREIFMHTSTQASIHMKYTNKRQARIQMKQKTNKPT